MTWLVSEALPTPTVCVCVRGYIHMELKINMVVCFL